MRRRGEVVVLNGTGSAGKTTLARALQDAAETPLVPWAMLLGVRCSKEVLIERTRARGDRPPGHELFAFDSVHDGRVYDVEVDTSDGDVRRCVDAILHRLAAGPARALAAARQR